MTYPRIYLVLDNCFAIKRWVKPEQWMELAKEIGFSYVEASTDNEIDPLFSAQDYMDDWFAEVERCSKKTGVKVVNFYTGYQTYRTVGLAHHDERMVKQLKENWLFNIIERIGKCGAYGLGFCFFAIPDRVLQNPQEHKKLVEKLYDEMSDIVRFAYEQNGVKISIEQMYAPHQPPFTISDSEAYMKNVLERVGNPLYITLDTGHMVGQHRFFKPSAQEVEKSFSSSEPEIWLGGESVHKLWEEYKANGNFAEGADVVMREMEKYPYMFAEERDADTYEWIRALAKYSPIFHMQQTDGTKSAHAPFTPETNKTGIITGEKLLKAIMHSYEDEHEIQAPVEDIYLSFEIFAANVDRNRDTINGLKQTLSYWREFVPEDGMRLDELVKRL